MSEKPRKSYRENQVIGSNALRVERNYEEPARQKTIKEEVNVYRSEPKKDADYAKINMLCTIVLAFVIIATLGVCVVFLKTQFSVNQTSLSIENVKQELNTLKRENIQMQEDLKNMVDLEVIYVEATTRLKMRLPGPTEVFYIEDDLVTYTTKYAPVEIEEEEISFGNILGYITRGW